MRLKARTTVLTHNLRTAGGALLIATASATFAAGAGAQETLQVGAAPFAAPVTFMNQESGAFGGYMVDLVAAIAQDNSWEIEYVPLLVQDLGPSLQNGDIDIAAGIFVDIEPTRQAFLLSQHVYMFDEGLYVPAADAGTYTNLEDLAGKRVAMQDGTYQMIADMGLFEVVWLESILDVLAAVEAGEVEAGITGGPTGAYQLFLGNYPGVRKEDTYEPAVAVPGVIGVRMEDTELMDAINASLNKFAEDGTLESIFAEYGAEFISE